MSSQPPIRIGNRERDSARRALDEHLAEGRLDLDEYADRYAKAALARFQNELDELFVDLPGPHATPAEPVSLAKTARPAAHPRSLWPRLRGLRVAACVALIAVAVSAASAWWVLWFVVPVLFWGGPFRYGPCGRRHHYARDYARTERVGATRL